jgi:hypothetical protein
MDNHLQGVGSLVCVPTTLWAILVGGETKKNVSWTCRFVIEAQVRRFVTRKNICSCRGGGGGRTQEATEAGCYRKSGVWGQQGGRIALLVFCQEQRPASWAINTWILSCSRALGTVSVRSFSFLCHFAKLSTIQLCNHVQNYIASVTGSHSGPLAEYLLGMLVFVFWWEILLMFYWTGF